MPPGCHLPPHSWSPAARSHSSCSSLRFFPDVRSGRGPGPGPACGPGLGKALPQGATRPRGAPVHALSAGTPACNPGDEQEAAVPPWTAAHNRSAQSLSSGAAPAPLPARRPLARYLLRPGAGPRPAGPARSPESRLRAEGAGSFHSSPAARSAPRVLLWVSCSPPLPALPGVRQLDAGLLRTQGPPGLPPPGAGLGRASFPGTLLRPDGGRRTAPLTPTRSPGGGVSRPQRLPVPSFPQGTGPARGPQHLKSGFYHPVHPSTAFSSRRGAAREALGANPIRQDLSRALSHPGVPAVATGCQSRSSRAPSRKVAGFPPPPLRPPPPPLPLALAPQLDEP